MRLTLVVQGVVLTPIISLNNSSQTNALFSRKFFFPFYIIFKLQNLLRNTILECMEYLYGFLEYV